MTSACRAHDSRFKVLCPSDAEPIVLHSGMLWAEGPVYVQQGQYLIWSDIPNDRMWRWKAGSGCEVFRGPSNYSNGNTLDLQGRLITCEHLGRRVTRTEPDNSITVLADSFEGKPLNSPNDVVVKSDGTIWFTDPTYGIIGDYEGRKATQEQQYCNVFRFDPADRSIRVVSNSFEQPNGLAFSPDESHLYVSDTGASHRDDWPRQIRRFDIEDGLHLVNEQVFAEISDGLFDGFRVDCQGNVWTSSNRGVLCYAPDGVLLGEITMDETVSNVEFGGSGNDTLFVTATSSLYMIRLSVTGALRPSP